VNQKFAAVLIFLAVATAFVQYASKDIIANPAGADKIAPTTNATPPKPKLTVKNINDPSAWSDKYYRGKDGIWYEVGEKEGVKRNPFTIKY